MIVTIAGVAFDFTPNDDELARISLEFAAFDGEVGYGSFPLPDPGSTILPVTGRQFKVEQGSALLTDGFILDWDRQRGPFRVGTEREYNITPMDANALLGGFLATITRPAEDDDERVMAFAAQYRPTWDTTWVLGTSTVAMPGKMYDSDQGFGELIADLAEYTGKTLFVHDLADGSGRCLHYHQFTEGHTCGLSINDDPAVQNGTTIFAPMFSPVFSRTSVDLRNVVRGRDQAGRIAFVVDDASVVAHNVDGLYHQATIDFETTGQADLNVKAAAYLASSKDDYDSRTVAIGPLDGTALALIRVGDLISVDSGVLALTGQYKRIAHMTLTPWGDKPLSDQWLATLELEQPVRRRARVKVIGPPPAPAPPWDPDGIVTFLSTECISTLLWAPGASSGGGTFDTDPVNSPNACTLSTVGSPGFQIAVLTATPWALDTNSYSVGFTVVFNSTWLDGPTIADTITVGTAEGGSTYGLQIRMNVYPGTHDGDFEVAIGAGPPEVHLISWVAGAAYLLTFTRSGDSGTATLNGTGDTGTLDSGDFNAATAVMTSDDTGASVVITSLTSGICLVNELLDPVDGQMITGELVGTGDDTETEFTTNFPYRSHSLHVYVDGIRRFDITETDPTTGAFEFADAPGTGTEIRVDYSAAANLG